MAKCLVVVTGSWPVTQGLPLALYELAEGTVSTDPLVATHCSDPKYRDKKVEWGPRHKPGLTNSKKGHEATAHNPTVHVFRTNAEHLMCNLTTRWILENAQSLSVCTYHNMDLTMFYDSSGEQRTTHSSE